MSSRVSDAGPSPSRMLSGSRFGSVCAYILPQTPSDAPGGPANRNRRPGEPEGCCQRRSLRLGFPAAVALANGADFLWGRPVGAVPIRSRFLAFCRSFGSCFVFFRAFAFESGPEGFRRYFDRERSLPFPVAVRKLLSYRSAVSRRSSLPQLSGGRGRKRAAVRSTGRTASASFDGPFIRIPPVVPTCAAGTVVFPVPNPVPEGITSGRGRTSVRNRRSLRRTGG